MMNKKQNKYLFTFILVITLAGFGACEGPMGPQGDQGEQGPPGPVGPAGANGSMIHAGEGAPEASLGNPGDFYLDPGSGHLYGPKTTQGWGDPQELGGAEGPQGPPGEDGSQIFAGSGVPDEELGSNGDYYLDRDNYDLYGPKTEDGWGTPIHLQGPEGEQGPEGPPGSTSHSDLLNLDADDHLQYLLVNGVRDALDGFAVTGIYQSGTIPIEGEGTRLMWYPGRAAFRAGLVDGEGEQWDGANIGAISVALGYNTTASSFASTAVGDGTTASGTRSTAMGRNTTASGLYSTAMGINTTASGTVSTALGSGSIASGIASTTLGQGTIAASSHSLSIGKFNDRNNSGDNTLFVAGNGSGNDDRSDALRLDFNGNLTIAGTLTESSDLRLKTGIEPLKTDVLDQLGDIRPVRYRFKEGTGHPEQEQIGLIAQEVQKQFPELVSTGKDGSLSLSYSKFSAVLLKAVQEQQAEIERLQAEVRRVNRLETQLAGLQAALQKNYPQPEVPLKTSGPGLLILFIVSGAGIFLFSRRQV
jgi:hypothetical protein